MPPPPLGLDHYEAQLAEEPDLIVRTIKRMLLWLHQSNARALANYSEMSDESPTEEEYLEALRAKGKDFSDSVKSATTAADFNIIEFLRSLFFPLAFDRSNTRFDSEMRFSNPMSTTLQVLTTSTFRRRRVGRACGKSF